jgi:hypothetical protein
MIIAAGESLYDELANRGERPLRQTNDIATQPRYLVEVVNAGGAKSYYAPRCATIDAQARKRRALEDAKRQAEQRSMVGVR